MSKIKEKPKEIKSTIIWIECPYCGEKCRFSIKGDSLNCPNCGTKVES